MITSISLAHIQEALQRLSPHIHRTPILSNHTIDELSGFEAGFKCEIFQKTGSFKIRGALNTLLLLGDDVDCVVTHSSGNHAQAVALASRIVGKTSHIVMPNNAPEIKKKAVRGYGGLITECEPTQEDRERTCERISQETGAYSIHPANDFSVICGQGTIGLEILEQFGDEVGGGELPDAIIVPVGGGGMISGIVTAIKELHPTIKVYGAEPLNASDAYRSFNSGDWVKKHPTPPSTIADGLKVCLCSNSWPIIRDRVDGIFTASEADIAKAFRIVYERMKLAIEPSAAVGVSVLLSEEFRQEGEREGIRKVAVVLCGGNVDISKIPSYLTLEEESEVGEEEKSG